MIIPSHWSAGQDLLVHHMPGHSGDLLGPPGTPAQMPGAA